MIRRLRDSLLRLYVRTPEHPTKYRIVQWLGRNWFPDKGVVAVAHPGLRLRLHPRDWIEYLLLRNEEYEPMTLAFLAANLRPGDAAILAGVNFGQHVAVAARAVGPTGLVIGLEPQPRALVKTWENLQLNGLSTPVRLVAAALGSRDELVPMAWADLGNTGAASLLDTTPGLFVQVVRLSRVLEGFGSAGYRLLLLDVQGFESNALAGLVGGPLPEIVVVEIDEQFLKRAGVTSADLLGQIGTLGYELRALDGRPVTQGSTDLPERNVVGLRPGVAAVWSRAALN